MLKPQHLEMLMRQKNNQTQQQTQITATYIQPHKHLLKKY